MEEQRTCSKCGSAGPFPKQGNQCKACLAAHKAAWYQARHPVKEMRPVPLDRKSYLAQYGKEHKELIAARKATAYRAKHPIARQPSEHPKAAYWRAQNQKRKVIQDGYYCADCGAKLNEQTCWCPVSL